MRPIDADALSKIVEDGLRNNPHKGGLARVCHSVEHAHFLDIICNMPIIDAPPNDPLTLDELREMGLFDWLWIEVVCPSRRQVFRGIESAYYQVFEDYTDGDALCCGWPGIIHEFEYEDYGKTWIAYRRKPEERK